MNQFRAVYRRRIDGNLICSFPQKQPEIIHSADTASYGKRNKYVSCNFPHHIYHCITMIRRCCDIQKNNFIRTGLVVRFRYCHRITRILKIDKVHTFYYSSIIYIQTWNNSFCQHLIVLLFLPVLQNFSKSASPHGNFSPDGTGRQTDCRFPQKHGYGYHIRL